jgi:lipopolysaccharide/colanic/teichoic acid biosynthesis glycosyltransferase
VNNLYLYSINFSQQPLHPSTLSVRKRLIDIVGAIVGLIITFMVAIPVAIVTFIHEPSPIFYSQIRCGLNGKTFRIWKFRSMIVDADKFKHLVENQAKGSHL